ncbi:MAG: T9SS type A sorting domain-containing protein [Brumimicrobium sp.]|nr:T9SS type A sorting domain-containing protein [Brumimicrobium sp.]
MKTILSILILIYPLVILSQNEEQPPIIFEGVAVSATEFFIDSTGKANTNTTGEYGLRSAYTTNTSYLVKVTRVLKGHEYIDTGYVEVITKLSRNHINNNGKYENYIPNMYPGIFFMELNTIPATLERETDNKNILQPFHFKPMKIDLNRYDCAGVKSNNYNIFYKTEEDLARFMNEEYGVDYLYDTDYSDVPSDKVNDESSQTKKKSVFLNDGSAIKNNNYQENLINYNQFIANSEIKKANQTEFTAKSSHTLKLELGNETMTDDVNFRYYEFDILASDIEGGYFDNLLIRLTYNTNAFGSNLVTNGNVIITRGANFNPNTYIDPNINVIDENSSTLGIPFGCEFNAVSLNRTKLSSIPQQILHVKITIHQCELPVNIEFFDILFTPIFSFYTINSNDESTDIYSYDSTDYGISIQDELCKPIITSFTPSVATGIGEVITIEGKYFGEDRFHNNGLDSAQVRFRNADVNSSNFPTSHLTRLDPIDYLYWSDTEIKVSATSLIVSENNAGIGTGKFIVKNKWGDNTTSNTELFVEYSIQNHGLDYGNEYLKKRGNLIYDTTGYVFAFNSEILNDSIKKVVTEKAIRDWACQTGVNFKILYDDLSQTPNSLISIGSSKTNSTDQFAYTDPLISVTCFQDEITKHEIFVTGFEIEMNSDTPWDYSLNSVSPTKFSYYSVLIHELGHAHQLKHVLNAEYELMRPTIALGQSRTFSPNLFAGTDDVINFNATNNYINCDQSPMVFGEPDCTTNSITESHIDEDVFVYPNPFTEQIIVDFNSNNVLGTEVKIYNLLGKVVHSSYYKSIQQPIILNLKNINKGIYLLKIKTGDRVLDKKIIKSE